ncbi:hypothetical protein [Qingshengfaniella alkalisoli]|uniref:DUF4398 domain-containing protein n=1 Tax=Qingshengfaniella alkalisoli TaxID=2599296 RepID=A0A5B8J1Q0_9RHOB|nr:hypothetical protein [Qingshengfaniella alkalisoli]QDY71101.1 hypothetical protein FPZ52_15425 [Qingshengfaniella alkalisoli]
MRIAYVLTLFVPLVTGCYATNDTSDQIATETSWGTTPAEEFKSPEIVRMEDEWAQAKQEVATERDNTVASGQAIDPQVNEDISEVLDRDTSAPNAELRLQRLQDAVTDARRLAELVRAG